MKWLIVFRDDEIPMAAAPNRAEAYRMCKDLNALFSDSFKVVKSGLY